jgi:hypothetical protein
MHPPPVIVIGMVPETGPRFIREGRKVGAPSARVSGQRARAGRIR